MMEKGGTARRSQRAASLTAQVLLNYQIEDENNNNFLIKSSRKHSVCKEEFERNSLFISKRGRKRSVVEAKLPETTTENTGSSNFFSKKQKLETGCSGHVFPVNKPFITGRNEVNSKKLTASVMPVVKSQSALKKHATPSPVSSTSSPAINSSSVNPILLLPVSLQTNRTSGPEENPQNVNELSLVTLRATSDIMNCFGLGKTIMNTHRSHDQWKPSRSPPATMSHPHFIHKFNTKNNTHSFTTVSSHSVSYDKCVSDYIDYGETQVEPLNLKMGETTIPSTKSTVTKPYVAQVRPMIVSPQNVCCIKKDASTSPIPADVEATKESNHSKSSNRAKIGRRKSRSSPDKFSCKLINSVESNKKHLLGKCPSPDAIAEQACTSPDVDDVHRKPRHTWKRKNINLRRKAVPAPGTLNDEDFIELQRRLFAEVKRNQRAKTKSKSKMKVKKSTSKRIRSTEDQSTNQPDAVKLSSEDQSSNGWKWTGKPYTSLVFSIDSGKYVKRKCYPGMERKDKRTGSTDVVLVRDCIFVLASGKEELSYIGKVSALWEKPSTKEMMTSLVWYYRPEHTEDEKCPDVCEDELFSSRHQDELSVACVEERCHVLTYSQFCRTHARSRRDRQWRSDDVRRVVPSLSNSSYRPMLSNETPISPRDVFYARQYYDVLPRRIKSKLPTPSALSH